MRSTFSNAIYKQLKSANQTMTDLIAGTSLEAFNFSSNGSSEIATAFGVSGNYFKVLGVSAVIGRTIEEGDDRADAEPVAVLSYPFWQKRFGGDPSVVGKTVRLNNRHGHHRRRAAGRRITGIQRMADTARDVTVPFTIESQLVTPPPGHRSKPRVDDPTYWYIQIAGRLKPGATLEQVKGNLTGPFEEAARNGMSSYMTGLTERNASCRAISVTASLGAATAGAARAVAAFTISIAPRRDRRRSSA